MMSDFGKALRQNMHQVAAHKFPCCYCHLSDGTMVLVVFVGESNHAVFKGSDSGI